MSNLAVHEIVIDLESCEEVRGGTGGSGTGLPAGRGFDSRLNPSGRTMNSLEQESVPGISPRGKSYRPDKLATFM
jgi:hypothetical protein